MYTWVGLLGRYSRLYTRVGLLGRYSRLYTRVGLWGRYSGLYTRVGLWGRYSGLYTRVGLLGRYSRLYSGSGCLWYINLNIFTSNIKRPETTAPIGSMKAEGVVKPYRSSLVVVNVVEMVVVSRVESEVMVTSDISSHNMSMVMMMDSATMTNPMMMMTNPMMMMTNPMMMMTNPMMMMTNPMMMMTNPMMMMTNPMMMAMTNPAMMMAMTMSSSSSSPSSPTPFHQKLSSFLLKSHDPIKTKSLIGVVWCLEYDGMVRLDTVQY